MFENDPKVNVLRFVEEIWNRGPTDAVDQLIVPQSLAPTSPSSAVAMSSPGLATGNLMEMASRFYLWRTIVPHARLAIHDVWADGETVVLWMVITGPSQVRSRSQLSDGGCIRVPGVSVFHLGAGQIVEWRQVWDSVGLPVQPSLAPAELDKSLRTQPNGQRAGSGHIQPTGGHRVRSLLAAGVGLLIVAALAYTVALAYLLTTANLPARGAVTRPEAAAGGQPEPTPTLDVPRPRLLGGPVRGPTVASTPPTQVPAIGAVVPGTLLDERFTDNRSGWPDNPQFNTWLAAEGGYHLSDRQPERFVAVGAPMGGTVSDVIVSGTFRKVGGPPGGGYGLILRNESLDPLDGSNQNGRFYVLEVGDKGEVGIWRREDDHWVELVPWTTSDAVHSGMTPNELLARAEGDQLSLAINGREVARVRDGVLSHGGIGVFAGGDGNDVLLEHLVVRAAG